MEKIKVVIQIPCHNEEESLGITLRDLPTSIPGVDVIEVIIIDDGSTDRTSEIARKCGVHRIVRFPEKRGLATAFMTGLQTGLALGADIIVNTDGDNQYCGKDIPRLIAPILGGDADMVIGTRPISNIAHFSPAKKLLQAVGSWLVRVVSGTTVVDAPSGFRAISRQAAMRLNVFGNFTYTLETIIQAGQKNIAVACIPIGVNGESRPSRLISSTFQYIARSAITIVRVFIIYRPFKFFFIVSLPFLAVSAILVFRFFYLYLIGEGNGYIQSLQIGTLAGIIGVGIFCLGILADMMTVNRLLSEDIQRRLWEIEDRAGKRAQSHD